MERIKLSKNGSSYSQIIAGCMRWGIWGAGCDAQGYADLIKAALSEGITTFDHADIYGDYTTEAEFGQAMKSAGIARKNIELISKCGIKMLSQNRPDHKIKSYNTSRAHIINSVEQSLVNLNTDYLDLLLIHRPSPLMDAGIVAEAFTTLKKEGKVLEFGVSNFTTAQFNLIHKLFPLVTNQLELSPISLDLFTDGTLTDLLSKNIKPQAWSPLGGQSLFGTQTHIEDTARLMRFQEICSSYGWSLADMALVFLLHHPAQISPVIGTSNAARIKAAAATIDMKITDEQWFEIWSASTGISVA